MQCGWLVYWSHVTFARFYIGCDHCDDWYHGSCVGITKSEADRMDTYICPVCRDKHSAVEGPEADVSSKPLQERHWLELRCVVTSLQVNYFLFIYVPLVCSWHKCVLINWLIIVNILIATVGSFLLVSLLMCYIVKSALSHWTAVIFGAHSFP